MSEVLAGQASADMRAQANRAAALAYLQHYARKDIAAIEAMLAEDVSLRDWQIAVQGKAAALAETRKNFASAGGIAIEVLNLIADANSVAAELKIRVDLVDAADPVELFVIDVISFNPQGQIHSIRAYLGRGEALS
ncbi:nuclear transport factor 2 family protein [Roseateles sp. PN1]|uniref:nuclear transport factor 2 family protein n=1 Tax=Roseateles sp. PN1 TaxID=3137372 RepID=UPI0031390BE4